jgi:hypothetical protein
MAQIQDKNRANAKIVLPYVGETIFDENGIAEVDDGKVNDLIAAVEGLGLGPGHRDNEEGKEKTIGEVVDEIADKEVVEVQEQEEASIDENEGVNEGSGDGDAISGGSGVIEPAEEQESSEEAGNEEDGINPQQSDDSDAISNEEVVNKIKTSNLKELKELAGALDVPKSEWVSLNKPELKDYLLNKIK